MDIRELTIKIAVDGSGAAMKLKSVTAALNKTQKAIKGTGKASTAAGKKFQKASKSMQTAAQRTEKKMRKLRASLGNIKESLRSLAQTATRTAAVMIAGASALVAVYSRFERAMMRSAAIASGSEAKFGTAFRSMSKEAMRVANTTEHTAKQVGEGMEFMAMAGLKANKIVASTASVADLASSAGIGMADAANIATNVMTAFGKKSEDLTEIHNVLTGTFTNSNVSLSQLAESMKVAGANASVLGLSMEEAAATIGLLGNVGMQGTEAGTKLKRAISAMVHPSKQGATAMSNLALSEETLVKNSKFVDGGLLRLIARLQGSQKAFREMGKDTKFLANVFAAFGERAGPAMAALLKQGTDAFIDLRYAQEEAKRTDITTWLAGLQRESTKGQWDIMVSNVTSAAIVLGQKLAPAAIKAMNAIKGLAEAIQGIDAEKLRALAKGAVAVTAATAGAAGLLAFAGGIVAIKYAVAGLGGSGMILGSVVTGLGGLAAVVGILSFPKLAGLAAGIGLVVASFGVFAGVASSWPIFILGAAVLVGTLVASLTGLNDTFASGIPKSMDWSYAINEATDSSEGFATSLEAFGVSFFSALLLDMKGINDELDELADRLGVIKAIQSGDPYHQFGNIDDYLRDVDKRIKEDSEKQERRKESYAIPRNNPGGPGAVDLYAKARKDLAKKINPFDLQQKEFEPVRKKIQRAIGDGVLLYVKDGISKLVAPSQRTEMLKNKTAIDSEFQWSGSDLSQKEFDKVFEGVNVEDATRVGEEFGALLDVTKDLVDDTTAGLKGAKEAVGPLLKRFTDAGFSSDVVEAVRTALYADIDSKSKANLLGLDAWLASLIKGSKLADKILAKAETDAAKQEALNKMLRKSFSDLIDFLKGRTRDMKAQMISAFAPDRAGGIKGAVGLAKEFKTLSQKLKKAKVDINDLGQHSSVVSGYFDTLAASTFSQAGAALAAKVGTDQLSKAAAASARDLAPAFKSAAAAAGNYAGILTFSAEEVQQKLEDYALAHADVAGMLKKATADRIKAEESYAASMGKLSAIIAGIEGQLELAKSKSPEMTAVFQEGKARKEGIDDTAEEAIKSAQAAKVATLSEIKLRSLLEKQNIIQEHLVKKMGDLSVNMTKLTAAIVNANPDQVTGKAEEAKSDVVAARASVDLSGLELAAQLAGVKRGFVEMGAAVTTFKGREEAARNKQNEGLKKNTELITLNAKALILQGGTIEELNNAMAEARKQGGNVEELTDAMNDVPFSKLAASVDSMSASLEDSFNRIGDLFIEKKTDPGTGEITGGSVLGQQLDKKQLQNLVNSKSIITDMLGNMGGETSGWGSMLGMGIGALIGSFAGNTAIGAKVGQAVGNVIEGVLGMVKKGFEKIYAAFGAIAKNVGKLSELVPENRFQSSVKQGGKVFAPIATAVVSFFGAIVGPVITAFSALVAAIGFVVVAILVAMEVIWGQWYFIIPTIIAAVVFFAAGLSSGAGAILAGIGAAAGGAIAAFLIALGMKELKYDTIAASPQDTFRAGERGETPENIELDEERRSPWTRIMDALAVSIDRVIFAMGPFYENLFALVGLFDMVMQAFVVIANSLGNLDFGENLYNVFKFLALRIIEVITVLSHLHNILMIGAQAHIWWNNIILEGARVFLDFRMFMREIMISIWKGIGQILNSMDPTGTAGQSLIDQATEITDTGFGGEFADWDQWLIDAQQDMNDVMGDLAQFIDPMQFNPLWDTINDSNWQDGLDRFNWLDDIAEPERKEDKEFGEQLTNVPSGFKVNLARYKAMDADGEGAAGDGDGGSLWNMGSNEYFRRLEDAIRNGNDLRGFMEGQSLSELGEEIRNMVDNLMDPASWGDIFGNSIREVGDELGNAVDSLTNTLGLALLGPEEAFQGASGVGPAMGGRQAGGDPTSRGSTMNININELSIADAANPEQLASMIAERSTRGQMAQAGTPFQSLQSGDAWTNGGDKF